jgi:Cu/Ag efflux pump CusA
MPLSVAVGKVQAMVQEMNLPPQYQIKLGGRAKALEETIRNFFTAFLLSLLFMYMVLAAQFESFLHPITIMLALPLSIPFAVFSLWLLGEALNVYSIARALHAVRRRQEERHPAGRLHEHAARRGMARDTGDPGGESASASARSS